MLKKASLLILAIMGFIPTLLIGAENAQPQAPTPQEVIKKNQNNNTDVYAIPYDDSEEEDEDEIKHLEEMQKDQKH